MSEKTPEKIAAVDNSGAAVVRDIMPAAIGPKGMMVDRGTDASAVVLSVPDGVKLHSVKAFLDENRIVPERRKGTAVFTDVPSFCAHALRFQAVNSVIFANDDRENPSMMSVLDYHEAGPDERTGTHNCEHRGLYRFPLSDEWKAWQAFEKRGYVSITDFAEFIENRLLDVMEPISSTPVDGESPLDAAMRETVAKLGGNLADSHRLLELSRGLKVHENSRVAQAVNLSSGEGQMVFQTEHADEKGEPLKVPNLFLIAIPVFANDAAYRLLVRLRYRLRGGSVTWAVERYRADVAFDDAFAGVLLQASGTTQMPVMRGKPEIS
ncbi:DUF2303 family protein (plasmid) [Novacetimonas hansenii]|uniref:DUF2303 family protein n=1 Tax=Novacetimonas hansenii TaxID=436 RepID=A0ABQ0SG09_NOVHA|nr:DUF2303 family protein [Novacetimonas hansenii]GAN83849.1 hypothetical protein Gaha_0105_084 [Novacetimonas hansenii JCM 7643]GBQ62909.1 hypothetical protein AA0243_2990 [Novacetimonas hansenii NRIC 0243]GEC64159.1 hypothetical protein GHA01_20080 [Novacetimonas hansenii]